MVASTDIKFYVHTNNNAPQLQNAYGSMIQVLDACLINGIQLGAVLSLTASGTSVTATFSTAHNLMQYQVIQIAGALQSEYNGQHRILTVPSPTTVTFELAAAPTASPATGTISASLPPLGWEKPFSSAGKAAYRSTNLLLPSRPFLRVVDELDPAWASTYAKYAKVGIVEDMLDIDTMIGIQSPYDSAAPDKNWSGTGSGSTAYNGWAKWYYARSSSFLSGSTSADSTAPSGSARSYLLVGNSDAFYIFPTAISADTSQVIYGFGSFNSLLPIDAGCSFLSATLSYTTAGTGIRPQSDTPICNTQTNTLLLFKNYSQVNYAVAKSTATLFSSTAMNSGGSNYSLPAITLGCVQSSDFNIIENSNVLRGILPLCRFIYQSKPLLNFEICTSDTEAYIGVDVAYGSATTVGQVLVKIGDVA